jgi:hypothetical protein
MPFLRPSRAGKDDDGSEPMGIKMTRCSLLALAVSISVAACNRPPGDDAPVRGATEPPETASAAPAATAAPVADARDADAIAALEKMGVALRAMDSFGLKAETSTDYVTDAGQKVSVDGSATWRVRAPDRFVVTVGNDRQQREFYYDGKTLTVWSPRLKYYAVIDPVPPTIGELVTHAAERGIEFPLPDLFLWGTPQAPLESVSSAFLVGPASLDGEETDHYAYRQPGADWQVWISRKTSLPAKVSITSQGDAALPTYSARLHWEPAPSGGDGAFAFKPPADARRIEFVPVDAGAAVEEP